MFKVIALFIPVSTVIVIFISEAYKSVIPADF